MPFSGGGGGTLTNHVHDNTPLQGGPLNFNNTTIAGMNQGDITYSDGNALQALAAPGVPSGQVLTYPAAATAPSWQAAGAGAHEFLGSDRRTTAGNPLTVSFAAQDGDTIGSVAAYFSFITTAPSPNYSKPRIIVNGITTANWYRTEWLDIGSGTGTFSQQTADYIETPDGARMMTGWIQFFAQTPQQAVADDTMCGWTIQTMESDATPFRTCIGGGAADVGGLPNTFTSINEVSLTLDTGNLDVGSQLSVFASKIS
jgi:hypothetical protein